MCPVLGAEIVAGLMSAQARALDLIQLQEDDYSVHCLAIAASVLNFMPGHEEQA